MISLSNSHLILRSIKNLFNQLYIDNKNSWQDFQITHKLLILNSNRLSHTLFSY